MPAGPGPIARRPDGSPLWSRRRWRRVSFLSRSIRAAILGVDGSCPVLQGRTGTDSDRGRPAGLPELRWTAAVGVSGPSHSSGGVINAIAGLRQRRPSVGLMPARRPTPDRNHVRFALEELGNCHRRREWPLDIERGKKETRRHLRRDHSGEPAGRRAIGPGPARVGQTVRSRSGRGNRDAE